MNLKSVRFFPHWEENNIYQVIGFLDLVNFILTIQPKIESWLEIGSHLGESSTLLLGFHQIKKIYCVECSLDACNILEQKFSQEIKTCRYNIINSLSDNSKDYFSDETFDVVYIDGNHQMDHISQDIKNYYPKIKSGGFLTGHDYNNKWPDVMSSVNNFLLTHHYSIQDLNLFRDGSWLIRKK
jgi:predicted O-methyltransferase YrrM